MTSEYGGDHTDEVSGPDPGVEDETATRQQDAQAAEESGDGAGDGPDLTGG